MKVIQSGKYRENQEQKILCFEVRKLDINRYQLIIYMDRYCQNSVGKIEANKYCVDEDHSEINLFDYNDLLFATFKYRIVFDMED